MAVVTAARPRGYGPRVDALLERLGSDLTEQDFAALGLACLDQAGLNTRAQSRIADELGVAQERAS